MERLDDFYSALFEEAFHPKIIDMKKPNYPTIEDVAQAAKVSTATISRAINDPAKVAKPTRNRIEAVIRKMGYTPNHGGRVLASSKSNTVGAIIPTMANSMFASGLQAFQEKLAESGITLLVASTGYDNEKEFQQIRSLMAQGADGLLLIGESRAPESIDYLTLRKIPYVISWSYKSDPARVFAGFDNSKAAYAMTRQILELGHRKIAMIAGSSRDNDRASERIEGVKRAVKSFGNNAKLTAIIETQYSVENGGNAFEQLMFRCEQPTAIVCGNDVLAAGAVVRAQKKGINIPKEVSITGFDDITLASVVTPPLTTVRVPQVEMGGAAAQLLLKQISEEAQPASIEFDTEIVQRESLAAPPSLSD